MRNTSLLVFILVWLSAGVVAQEVSVKKLSISKNGTNEMAPFVKDSVLYFSTNKNISSFKKYFNENGDLLYHIFAAQLNADSTFGKPQRFLDNYFSPRLNTGSYTFSKDGQQLYIAQNQSEKSNSKSPMTVGVFIANKEGDDWSKKVAFPYNSGEYNITQPAISSDGQMLFFVTDYEKGNGKTDIYYSEKINGEWSSVQNMGPSINTSESELFPYYHPSGKLYFASNGHGGRGGLDIFYTKKTQDGWSQPIALDSTINSAANDYSCYISDDEKWGIFTSDIDGSDNLYRFDQLFPTFDACEMQIEDSFCFEFFDDVTTENETDGPYVYRWTFNNNEMLEGDTVIHCFDGAGEYMVKLSMVDKSINEELFALTEYPLSVQRSEQIYISSPDTVKVNEYVSLSVSESNLGDFTPEEFYWELDDGGHMKGETIHHIFRTKGEYMVKCGAISSNNPQHKMCSMKLIIVSE